MSKLLLGSISLCVDGDPRNESRIKTHQSQLRWLESVKFKDYIYYRVEQEYTPEFSEAVKTSLNLESLSFPKRLGPAGARNELLKKLYDSDSDWLICMDDDRELFSHYRSNDFLRDLAINPATIRLAKEGTLITGLCPMRRPFKKANLDFGRISTHWNIIKGCIDGCLQISCIPNLVKYGYKPVWFDSTNDCMHGTPPEDIQFELDWILAKHPLATNLMMIVRDTVQEIHEVSTIYSSQELRREVMATHPKAIKDYIKLHTHNRFTDLNTFNRYRNGYIVRSVPRLEPYTPVQSDYGKYLTLEEE